MPCLSSVLPVDNVHHALDLFRRSRQVLIAVLGDQHIILDADPSDGPILFKYALINIPLVLFVVDVRLNDEFTEVYPYNLELALLFSGKWMRCETCPKKNATTHFNAHSLIH